MDYTCVLTLNKIKAYLAGAAVVGFDFETSPLDEYRDEDRAALDAHKAAITGVSLSVSEGSGIYVPLRHRTGKNILKPEAVMAYLKTPCLKTPPSLRWPTTSLLRPCFFMPWVRWCSRPVTIP